MRRTLAVFENGSPAHLSEVAMDNHTHVQMEHYEHQIDEHRAANPSTVGSAVGLEGWDAQCPVQMRLMNNLTSKWVQAFLSQTAQICEVMVVRE